ncbi:hypothetical protein C8J57DRAFT_1500282 [Mycena rebaudengoi]|nr:hypothetical protein C8J57DRAFT_1500282 [Mycena rebaudengoi]
MTGAARNHEHLKAQWLLASCCTNPLCAFSAEIWNTQEGAKATLLLPSDMDDSAHEDIDLHGRITQSQMTVEECITHRTLPYKRLSTNPRLALWQRFMEKHETKVLPPEIVPGIMHLHKGEADTPSPGGEADVPVSEAKPTPPVPAAQADVRPVPAADTRAAGAECNV